MRKFFGVERENGQTLLFNLKGMNGLVCGEVFYKVYDGNVSIHSEYEHLDKEYVNSIINDLLEGEQYDFELLENQSYLDDRRDMLKRYDWVIESDFPLIISHPYRGFASKYAAEMVVEYLRSSEGDFFRKLTEKLKSDSSYYLNMAIPVTGEKETLYVELCNELSDLYEWCRVNYRG